MLSRYLSRADVHPGDGELAIIDRLPREVQTFLSAAIQEVPSFLHEYVLPTLAGLDAEEKIVEDLSLALAELEIEEEIYGVDPDDYEYIGDPGLGFLGKSLSKKIKKVVKKVVAPVKKIHDKIEDKIIPKKLATITKKITDAPKRIHEKAKDKISDTATRGGKILHRAAKSGKLQIALAPFTAGVSLAFHPKVGIAAKKFMAGPYGNVVVGALGAIFAIPTGGASIAAAAALTTANTMYQKKKQAEAAKKAQKANANEISAEADQLQADTERQLNEFYTRYASTFQQYGVTQAMWDAMSTDEKIGLLDQFAAGTGRFAETPTQPPAGGGTTPPSGGGYTPPSGGGSGPTSGGGGSGGGGGENYYDPYKTGEPDRNPAVAKAGMSELLGPAAIGIGLLAVFMQSKKKGGRRTRRNPRRSA